jgi:hypothetical protein
MTKKHTLELNDIQLRIVAQALSAEFMGLSTRLLKIMREEKADKALIDAVAALGLKTSLPMLRLFESSRAVMPGDGVVLLEMSKLIEQSDKTITGAQRPTGDSPAKDDGDDHQRPSHTH